MPAEYRIAVFGSIIVTACARTGRAGFASSPCAFEQPVASAAAPIAHTPRAICSFRMVKSSLRGRRGAAPPVSVVGGVADGALEVGLRGPECEQRLLVAVVR